ncbi:glycosyltransferase [Acetobacter aceti NRIC 0242]|uniref:Glycosyl transferase n=1 Tax=Acetobacter aceti NBRC 14818 TaxID=887700 RepID=A0AB33ICI9_ACEAC|nr:glycosyltransferase [Acetobacter aceti]TCS28550.1 glycosyl transferase-like sugar-binding protein [Acetobacter aceti NBRC 14818]BCK75990.1 hypothetical protein EMQ_1596 [Acetobacter aceti NBRC 14818]GAN58411.1 hypothetical protein Abac_049_006 [Acetobacter aceti NBRC 14818]GBO81563.1 glycosyltransferase [Acetobacter aceti NRIC 0242]
MNAKEFDLRGRKIPRIIYQTIGDGEIPLPIKENIEKIKKENPEWDYRLYRDKDIESFIETEFGNNVLKIYKKIDDSYGAARADLFRYLILYKYGGVYLDIKSRFYGPISQFVKGDEGFIISQWSNAVGEKYEGFGLKSELSFIPGGEFQQWHIIAAPGHPFLREVVESIIKKVNSYRPWKDGTGKVGVLNLTGPIIYTKTIYPILDLYPHKFIRRESDIGLEYSIFGKDKHKNAFVLHYSKLQNPIVKPSFWLQIPYALWNVARKLKSIIKI